MQRIKPLLLFLLMFAMTACAAPSTLPTQPVVEQAPPDATANAVKPQVAAANAQGEDAAVEPTADETEPEATATLEDEPVVAEVPAAEPNDWLTTMGRTEEGLATLGNPDAAVILIDYSDFL